MRTMSKLIWHPCSERLPDSGRLVSVTVEEPGRWYTGTAVYWRGAWYLDGCEMIYGRVLEWAEERYA